MTERERIQKNYAKVQMKYPNVTDKEEIDRLAIKLDKHNLLWKALGLFGGAILCYILNRLLSEAKTDFSDTRAILFILMLSALFEMVRTIVKYFKVENNYKPVMKIVEKQMLDVATILKNCGSKMRNLSEFSVIKEKLYDKEDAVDLLYGGATRHDYFLYFKHSKTAEQLKVKVKKDMFENAVIGSEYFVILTKDKEWEEDIAIYAYPAVEYTLSENVVSYCDFEILEETPAEQVASLYQPNQAVFEEAQPVKKVLPIISLILNGIGFFMFGILFVMPALILSIIAVTRQKSKLSIASLIVSIINLVLLFAVIFML